MKKIIYIIILFVAISCDKDEVETTTSPLYVQSIMVEGKDIGTGAEISKDLSDNDSNIPLDAVFTVSFSKEVDASTIKSNTVMITSGGTVIPADVNLDQTQLTVIPQDSLEVSQEFTLVIGNEIRGMDGGFLSEAGNFSGISRSFKSAGGDNYVPPGQVAYWNFEENAEDQVGDYDAVAEVDVTYVDGRSAAAGKAASFNGSTTIIEIPNGPSLQNTSDFTLSFWMKANSSSGKGQFVMALGGYLGFQFEIPANYSTCKLAARYEIDGGTTAGEDLWCDASGNLGWQGWTYSRDFDLAAEIKDKWAQIVCVYNGETKEGTIYINGEKAKSQDFDNWPDGDAKRNVVGLKYEGGENVGDNLAFGFYCDMSTTAFDFAKYSNPDHNHFMGELDDIRFFHSAVTEEGVSLMYSSEKP